MQLKNENPWINAFCEKPELSDPKTKDEDARGVGIGKIINKLWM